MDKGSRISIMSMLFESVFFLNFRISPPVTSKFKAVGLY